MGIKEAISSLNVFAYAAQNEKIFEASLRENNDSERQTTFFSDLSIAEWCEDKGEKGAIVDTFNRVCNEWLNDYKFFTEFVVALNVKAWQWYQENNEIAKLYSDLYYRGMDKFYEKYDSDSENDKAAREWFFRMTD